MKTMRKTNREHNAAHRAGRPAPGLRAVMTLLAVLALAVGFATAKADPGTGAAGPDGWEGYETNPYRVNIWHDRGEDEVYQRGEAVRIHFESNRDAYAVVYRIDTEGRVEILWPRSRYDDGFIFGHHTYNLPTPGAERIRAADEEGVEFVQALVSAYPFDLRGLDVDFHHERDDDVRAYYVAGDPFLAMNDINYAITGLEDAADFVVTNYLSYYVHRQVDHPRYMCLQCHDDDMDRRPYDDVCVVEIHHDYSWDNGWFDRHRYYPVYYYPVYYYVDPWTWRPWINYWYRPWYAWPHWGHSPWGFDCYVWNYSPHFHGDVWVRYKGGDRRYRPIVKGHRYAEVQAGDDHRHPGALVKTPRPTREMVDSMENRVALRKDRPGEVTRGGAAPSRGGYDDKGRATRPTPGFTREDRPVTAPGLRVPSAVDRGSGSRGTSDSPAVRSGSRRGEQTPTRVTPGTKPPTRRDETRSVRPVKPNTQGERIWQGGSREPQRNTRTVKPSGDGTRKPSRQQVTPRTNRSDTPTVRPSKPKSTRKSPTVKPSKPKSTNKSPTVKPSKRSSSSSSGGSVKSNSSGSSRRSSGASKSSGSRSSGSSRGSSNSKSSRGRG